MANATDSLLVSLPTAILDHIADLHFASPGTCPHKRYHKDHPEGRGRQGLRSTAVLEACRELSACFGQAHSKALLAACVAFYPSVVDMASTLSLSRVELTRLLTLIKYYDDDGRHFRDLTTVDGRQGRDDAVDTIPWHYDPLGFSNYEAYSESTLNRLWANEVGCAESPRVMRSSEYVQSAALAKVPLLAPFDPNLVHILVRVRFRDEPLFSAHGTWAPRARRRGEDGTFVPLLERSHALIDLAMTPAAPTLTTPATLFGHQEGHQEAWFGNNDGTDRYDLASDAWLRRTDVARNEQLGTVFSEAAWGEMQRQTCPATDAFQVDIRLVHVHPTCKKMHPTCKKGECEPRDMRWANLCTSARFRTEADEMLMQQNLLPEESCGCDVYASGLIRTVQEQDHTKTHWRLSAALPFGQDYEPLSRQSVDGIFYPEPGEPIDFNWLEVNFDLESILQPWTSSSQVHAVRSASLGIVWKVQGGPQDDQVGVMEKVPSRIEFEGDTHGWQA